MQMILITTPYHLQFKDVNAYPRVAPQKTSPNFWFFNLHLKIHLNYL